MNSLSEAKVNMKAYRTWYKLNQNKVISVITPSGISEKAEVGGIMAHGSGGAALASGLDIARGVQSYFSGSQDEVSYGRVRGQPQSYQEYILKLAPDVSSARAGNAKLTTMMRERQLTCHPTKTCYLVYGSKRCKEQVKKELAQEPLVFGDFQVRPKESDVYLGDTLAAARGLEAGAEATVAKLLVEDFRLQAIGGMEGAWDL